MRLQDPVTVNSASDYWVDTHTHIYSEEFKIDREDMLVRAGDAGVKKMFMPNVDHASIDGMMELERKYPQSCFPMMGLHPCSVKKDFEKELYIVETWLHQRKFCAIGEMGTDLHWDKTFWDQQKEAFRIQAAWAKKFELPLVIHSRESIDETIEILESLSDDKLTGIFHCFSGTADQAKRIIALGFRLGIGGVVTFKNGGLDKVLPEVTLNNIVLETDSPYLAPVPHRGKRNEPAYIPLIAEKVCDLMKVNMSELQSATTSNSFKIFANAGI
ncbi:MAG: TatD family hydrolase [Cyclobacteriaceae bacterium]|nr:TatD family hydrolase [Cyclobacteriaceae bacterium]